MPKLIDEKGNTYGRLKVVEKYDPKKHGFIYRPCTSSYWFCECECGIKVIVAALSLRTGNTKSCGCLREETSSRNGAMSKGRKLRKAKNEKVN